MLLWYLGRAVPWTTLLGCLTVGGALTVTTHRWESVAGLGLPLVALVSASAAAFLLDEPAVAVTTVAARGGRWATSARLAVGLVPLAAGAALLLAAPDQVRGDGTGWVLVLAGLLAVVLLLTLVGARRQVPRPGATVASAVVLLGMAPMVLGMFLDWRSPYPMPDLSHELQVFWTGALAAGLLGCGVLVLSPASAPGARRRRRPPLPRRPRSSRVAP